MPILPRTYASIVESLRNHVTNSLPEIDTKPGTFIRRALVDPFCVEFQYLEELLLSVQQSQSLLSATGVDLDLLAANYNVQRRGSQKASGFVTFYLPQSALSTPITIPVNTLVVSTTGVKYRTLLAGVLNGVSQAGMRTVPTYEIIIPVISEVLGTAGNSIAGRLTSTPLSNVSVINDSPIEGGYESETDDSLAARALLSFGIWSRGVKSAVEFGARLVPGVYYSQAVTDYPGHFNIYCSDQQGNLSEEMRTSVFDILVDWAAAGVEWTVLRPPVHLLNMSVKAIFNTDVGTSPLIDRLRSDIASILNVTKTNSIYLDDLVVAIKEKTASYVVHFDIDSPNEHVIRPEGEIIRAGVITVTSVVI